MPFTAEQIAENLKDVQERLACMNQDLARMPTFKLNTPWHLDRVRERQHLLAAVDRLRGAALEAR